MTKLRPLNDRIIVKRLEEVKTSSGGIVIPDSAAEKPNKGSVIAVGPGKVLEDGTTKPINIKIGEKVLFGKYSGTEIRIDGEDTIVLREDDIMAIIE